MALSSQHLMSNSLLRIKDKETTTTYAIGRNASAPDISRPAFRLPLVGMKQLSNKRLIHALITKFGRMCFDDFVSHVTYRGFLVTIQSVIPRNGTLHRDRIERVWRLIVKNKWMTWQPRMPLEWRKAALKPAYEQVYGCPGFDPKVFWAEMESAEVRAMESREAVVQRLRIAFNPGDLLLHPETGLLIPSFKQKFGFVADFIKYGTFLIGLDTVNEPILCPIKAAAAWKFFIGIKMNEWKPDLCAEEKAAKLKEAYAQADDTSEHMKTYWADKPTNPKLLKISDSSWKIHKGLDAPINIDTSRTQAIVEEKDADVDDEWDWKTVNHDEEGGEEKSEESEDDNTLPVPTFIARLPFRPASK